MKNFNVGDYITYFTASTIELKEEHTKQPYVDYYARIDRVDANTITVKYYNMKHTLDIPIRKILSYKVISKEEYKKLKRKC